MTMKMAWMFSLVLMSVDANAQCMGSTARTTLRATGNTTAGSASLNLKQKDGTNLLVPPGCVAVLEFVSFDCTTVDPNTFEGMDIGVLDFSTSPVIVLASFTLLPVKSKDAIPQAPNDPSVVRHFVASQAVKIRADAGEAIVAGFAANRTTLVTDIATVVGTCRVGVSGYWEPTI